MHIEVVWSMELSHRMVKIRRGVPRSFCSFSLIDGADEFLFRRDRTVLVAKLEPEDPLEFDIPASDALSSNSNHQ